MASTPLRIRELGLTPASHNLVVEPRRAPIAERTDYDSPSVFNVGDMLREAGRQRGLKPGLAPPVCVLDPDGDIVRHLRCTENVRPSGHWACFHTDLWTCKLAGLSVGFVGCAVGGSFAVLVAEQLFASGCEVILNISSAGQITNIGEPPPYYVLIERALRDEGTSYHYLPPAAYADIAPEMLAFAQRAFSTTGCSIHTGSTWTTDAPFRETAEAIAERRREGILAVEMEAASLYAFGAACGRPVVCLAHVTNQLGCIEGDFEKGEGNGARNTLALIGAFASAWTLRSRQPTLERKTA